MSCSCTTPEYLNCSWPISAGDGITFPLSFVNAATGQPSVLAGYSTEIYVLLASTDANSAALFSAAGTGNLALGQAFLTLTDTFTLTLTRGNTYFYRILLIDPNGVPRTVVAGPLPVF